MRSGTFIVRAMIVAMVAVVLVACESGFNRRVEPKGGEIDYQAASPTVDATEAASRDRAGLDVMDDDEGGLVSRATTGTTDLPIVRMVIRTAQVSIKVDKCDPILDSLVAVADRFGGYVGSSDVSVSGYGKRGAAVLRVPAEKFSGALAAVLALGDVQSKSVSGEDVTEEYFDLEARLKNARATEQRYIEILRSARNVAEILEVEAQIDQVRERIERFEGRMRYLESSAALSTITVEFYEPQAVYSRGGGVFSKLGQAFEDAFDGFIGVVAGLIVFLGVAVPFALIALVIVWLILKMVRRGWFSWLRGRKAETAKS